MSMRTIPQIITSATALTLLITLPLAHSSYADSVAAPKTCIRVDIQSNGDYQIEKVAFHPAQIVAVITSLTRSDPDAEVILRSDKSVRVDTIKEASILIYGAGIKEDNLSYAIRPPADN